MDGERDVVHGGDAGGTPAELAPEAEGFEERSGVRRGRTMFLESSVRSTRTIVRRSAPTCSRRISMRSS
ncbi:hypothetical protein AB0K87_36100, partial [Streptomyces sp. NPDC053705]|uniref:hypothetical protein n=1 Tax=Streptomyces sp. NPDC053705 TaxID=3156668 RepID=UPI00344168FA